MEIVEKVARAICEADNCSPDAISCGLGNTMPDGVKYKLWEARVKQANAAIKALATACFVTLLLSSCATIMDGNDQKITINTTPPGSNCTLNRNGETIANVNAPGTISIEKTKHDIDIKCSKPGYQTASYHNHSGIDWWTAGNLAILTPTGWAIDSIAGSDNKYDSQVNITLTK